MHCAAGCLVLLSFPSECESSAVLLILDAASARIKDSAFPAIFILE